MAEEFRAWITENELDEDTVKMLAELGFVSLKSCSKLNDSLVTKHFGKSLPPAQFLLLQDAVTDLKKDGPASRGQQQQAASTAGAITEPATQISSIPGPSTGGQNDVTTAGVNNMAAPMTATQNPEPVITQAKTDLDFSKLCQLLDIGQQNAAANELTKNSSPGKLVFDPFAMHSHSTTLKSKQTHRDIRDFVMFCQQYNNDKNSNVRIGDFELSLCEKKVPLEKITPLQWMEGSLKILKEMVVQDNANLQTVMEYVSYLTKVACMGQSFTWGTVIKYDAEYRKTQSMMGFPWGADSPFLMQLLLRPTTNFGDKPRTSNANATVRQRQIKHDPASGRPVCEKFNSRAGCSFRSCRYAHVCMVCYASSHGETTHKPQQTRPTSTEERRGGQAPDAPSRG